MWGTQANVYLGLGSNLGDRLKHIQFGIDSLSREPGQKVCKCSSVYETTPWGVTDQPLYLNAAVLIESRSFPMDLLRIVKRIEKSAGRTVRDKPWAERELDIDILIFAGVMMSTKKLRLPHARLLERRFALRPLADLDADLLIPSTQLSVGQALANCQDHGEVNLYHKALKI